MPRRMLGPGVLATALAAIALVAVLAGAVAAQAGAAAAVTTAGYGTLRDNWDANEPALSPSAVQSASFGELFATKLSGAIYAQPLVYGGDVIVTTEEANAYAVDATSGKVVWQRSFGTPFKSSTISCADLKPNLGSTSTPVIDQSTGIIYMTTRLEEGGRGLSHAHWKLQAISAATGEEEPGYPVAIAGTPSNTPGSRSTKATRSRGPRCCCWAGSSTSRSPPTATSRPTAGSSSA